MRRFRTAAALVVVSAVALSLAAGAGADRLGNTVATIVFAPAATLEDTTAPVLSLPGPLTAEATSAAGAAVTFTASATDDVDGDVPVTCSPTSGSTFAIGTTTVTCSATDAANNPAEGSFGVTVADTTPPTLSLPGAQTAETTSTAGTAVTFTASASDAVSGAVTVSCTPSSGSTFAIGTTTVNCSASDGAGNGAQGSFTVTVTLTDATAPTLSLPGPLTAEATSASGAVVTFNASATDNLDGSVPVSCTPSSGSTFAIGTTTVTCSATDTAGNGAQGTFTVTVADSTKPTLSLPGPLSAEATSAAGAVVTFTASASDNLGAASVSCTPASGSSFPIGTTTVTCSATDSAGNGAQGSFAVTVADTVAPEVTVPSSPVTAEATGPTGAVVTFASSATDAVAGSPATTCTPASGSTFRIGSTQVTCTALDAAGNRGSATFTVTVTDGAPTVVTPPTQTVEATGPDGAKVTFIPAPSGSDVVDGALRVTCSPASGSQFPVGSTQVACSAVDSAGTTATGSFTVVVVDTTAPVVTAPPAATFVSESGPLPRSTPALAAYLARGRASDLVSETPVLYVEAPDAFPYGETIVRYIAVDGAGNTDVQTTRITIVPPPPPGQPRPTPPPPDPAPGNVSGVRAVAGNRSVRVSWTAPRDGDIARYVAFRSLRTGTPVEVFSGAGTSFTDRGLVNGIEYRYVIVAYDRAGQRSVGVAVLATPYLPMLLAPKDGARLARPTTFTWRPSASARYYNFQLFRVVGTQLQKVLSAWPVTNRFQLRARWKFEGRTYRLVPSRYKWYVWPGLGARADARYGTLLGERSFVVTRRRR